MSRNRIHRWLARFSMVITAAAVLTPRVTAQDTQFEALKQMYEQRISDLEEQMEEDPEAGFVGWPGFRFHGYLRSGYGVDGNGNVQDAFQAPNASAKYRLGNETETYLETSFVQEFDPQHTGDARFETVIRLAYVTPLADNNTFDTTTSLREAYALAEGVVASHPEMSFWAGERFYDRWDIHMLDFFYRDLSGYGGGFEDLALGDWGRLALAWIGGSQDELDSRGTPPPENSFRFNKDSLDLRLYGMESPLGVLQLVGIVSSFDGEQIQVPEEDPVSLSASTGWSGGFFIRSEPSMNMLNRFGVQYGVGAAENFRAVVTPPVGADVTDPDLAFAVDDMWRFTVTEDLVVDVSENWSFQLAGVIQELENGVQGDSRVSWYSAGIRPVYHFTRYIALAMEAGVDYTDTEGGASGSLYKFTIAPKIVPGVRQLDRPALRMYATWASWSDEFRGQVATHSFAEDTEGFGAGVQIESWW